MPTLNEGKYLHELLSFLSSHERRDQFEVLVVDGGSEDDTITHAESFDCRIINAEIPSRARQMNLGAAHANGDILYFVHADVGLLASFVSDIENALNQGFLSGCFSCKYVGPTHPLLKVNAWFTRFSFSWCRGGDQTLFITKSYFNQLGGYDERCVIMEDYELLDKLLSEKVFTVIKKDIRVSARKYKANSYMKVQIANLKAMKMYKRGEPTQKIKEYYLKALKPTN